MRYLQLLFVYFIAFNLAYGQTETIDKQLEIENGKIRALQSEIQIHQSKAEQLNLEKCRIVMDVLGVPAGDNSLQLVKHSAMYLGYAESYEQAAWVMHVILPEVANGNLARTNDFREDSLVTTGTAAKNDYWNSGYDRGHLAPSADFRWSATAISESYYYSNMSPQRPELNRERWAELEDLMRTYVMENERRLVIVSGPVLRQGLSTIGSNKVAVPQLYYKVAIDPANKVGIGFIMPNSKCENPVLSYSVSIDSVEQLTGLNFFQNLNKQDEILIESKFNNNDWRFGKDVGNVDPIKPEQLKKGEINTLMAKYHIGEKATICGYVVSTKYTEKSGATFINLDRKFPKQVFTITIWKDDRTGFSYKPEEFLMSKNICVTGKVSDNKGVATVNITNEKAIEVRTLNLEEQE